MGVKQGRGSPDYQGGLGAPERQRGRTRSDAKSQIHVKEAEATLPIEKEPQPYLPTLYHTVALPAADNH